ncbi:MAG: hypothetical protein HON94_14980 [Methylococcales bacterium]|jgi:hypothetical protein|nr:hypothetical protein [Methylococcales bacterium]MBT7408241.1 hypothetical protein [Methylococcales bacterium]
MMNKAELSSLSARTKLIPLWDKLVISLINISVDVVYNNDVKVSLNGEQDV